MPFLNINSMPVLLIDESSWRKTTIERHTSPGSSAIIVCPGCSQDIDLQSLGCDILSDGAVNPFIVCPNCTLVAKIILKGWQQ